jgi:probable phosphoglycerate mutase
VRIVQWCNALTGGGGSGRQDEVAQSAGETSQSAPAGRVRRAIAVTHKGVIKALLGLAFDWDLTGKDPVKLNWDCAHLFRFDAGCGAITLVEPNIALDQQRPDSSSTTS